MNFKMKTPFEKSKFTIGLILLIQSVSFLIMSFAQWGKRKSLAGAFLAISAIGGIVGTVLVIKSASVEEKRLNVLDSLCGNRIDVDGDVADFEVPVNEEIDETEFSI